MTAKAGRNGKGKSLVSSCWRSVNRFLHMPIQLGYSQKGIQQGFIARMLLLAYSEACRSAFRNDVDQHSEVVPISIPN